MERFKSNNVSKFKMAKLILDGKEEEIKDGDHIKDALDKLGVIIACSDGSCGVCKIDVEEGMENLSEFKECEKEMGCENNERLGCQCKLIKGEVKVKSVF